MSWKSLPAEIQIHILEALVLHEDSARYASICRAWQTIIERKNFARLEVTRSRLAAFGDIGYRHRHLVKYIWFSIEPSEHHCPDCGGEGIPNWQDAPTKTIRNAIQDIVTQLSTWEPRGGLLLDISVKAPNGLGYSSRTIEYGSDVISEPKKAKKIHCLNSIHVTKFQVPAGYLLSMATDAMKPEPEREPSKDTPKAKAVTSLLLRRQTRQILQSKVLEELLDLLPAVREIHYESWRDTHRMEKRPINTSKAQDTLL